MSAHTKPIPGHPGYFADRDGVIYSTAKWRGQTGMRALAVEDNRRGYLRVRMVCPDGKRRIVCVHKVMALTFLPPKPSIAHEIRHVNGNSHDNRAYNLAWGTRKENAMDREAHGRTSRGKAHGLAISDGLTDAKTDRLIAAAPIMYEELARIYVEEGAALRPETCTRLLALLAQVQREQSNG